ncbi:MAG: hypothetical protein JW950_08275 [Deltaproteobacteria bacterium]|nr:hypothetical protein [Deltaproteobacteria bacterium]
MNGICIIAAGRNIDGKGDLAEILLLEDELRDRGLGAVELVVDPLAAGWETPIADGHYRSGCGPLEALRDACGIIASGKSPLVVISGDDPLKTGYSREQRHEMMAIYGKECSLPVGYTAVARAFMARHNLRESFFRRLAEMLFENYLRTARRAGSENLPGGRWYEPVTDLFRGVDCANPVVDFAGRVVLCGEDLAVSCAIPPERWVRILGIGLGSLPLDGPASVADVAAYAHLEAAFREACRQSDVDFAGRFLKGQALLEAYTCYPVVPLAFLLHSGIAPSLEAVPELLERFEITVTGGMNLGRAAWNNPALNALIAMVRRLTEGPIALGGIHGNGGLGYRQGVALLARAAHSR